MGEDLLRKLLPGKFPGDKSEKDDKDLETEVMKTPSQSMSLKSMMIATPKTPNLDDSFSLWDEVYGVREQESQQEKKEEKMEKNVPQVESEKPKEDIKQFAKNMVRNILKPSKSSPRPIEARTQSQE